MLNVENTLSLFLKKDKYIFNIQNEFQLMEKLNPHVSVDCVVFGFNGDKLMVLLVDRNIKTNNKNQDLELTLKLPGSLVYDEEDVDSAAYRVLKELTGLDNIYLQQFHVFGSPDRLKKEEDLKWLEKETKMKIKRVVTIAYYSLIKIYKTQSLMKQAIWKDIRELPELAFDHREIIKKGLTVIRRELQNEPIAFELLSKKFTIRQLQTLHEIILNKKLDNRNFRKSIAKMEYIIAANEKEKNVAHKPAQFFKFDRSIYNTKKQYFNYKK